MNSKPFSLNANDVIKSLVTAIAGGVLVAVIGVLHGVVTAPGFDVLALDWGQLGHDVLNAAVLAVEGAFMGYLTKNFFSDENGAVLTPFGRIGGK